MQQAVGGPSTPSSLKQGRAAKNEPCTMKNAQNTVQLEAVRPGDVLALHDNRFHVLTSQQHAGLVTLELEDLPDHPLTLIGVAGMKVTIEPVTEPA
jgi:hypothetical protein